MVNSAGESVELSALASYQRSLLAGNSRFDRRRYGGVSDALSTVEQAGYALFVGRAGCVACHLIGQNSALLTDQQFHDTGYGWQREQRRQKPPTKDLGRYEVTQRPVDLWRYRTPQLRNVALTAPYMHDGGLSTLHDVLAFYNQGGAPHPGQSPLIRPLGLDQDELASMVSFLSSLTSAEIEPLVDHARVRRPDSP